MMGSASTVSPTPIGMPMTAEMRMESSPILAASVCARRAIAPEIAGTMATVSGVMNAAGRLKSVCALPYTP